MPDKYYATGSNDYLRRARERLDEGTPEALFYAAFELRCGIEARMQQYLEVQDHLSKKKKSGWRIAVLGKTIDQTFKIGNKIAEFTFLDDATGKKVGALYYTPVTSHLRKKAEELGILLHTAKKYRDSSDSWWENTRANLEAIYEELRIANLGTLLGVPLIRAGKFIIYSSVVNNDPVYDFLKRNIRGHIKIDVKYLDKRPEHLK